MSSRFVRTSALGGPTCSQSRPKSRARHPGRNAPTPAFACVSHRPHVSWRGTRVAILFGERHCAARGRAGIVSARPLRASRKTRYGTSRERLNCWMIMGWDTPNGFGASFVTLFRCRQARANALVERCTAPGVVRLSLAHDPATIAELLVHEASHAYFHLLAQAGPVDDGSDRALYYSPFKGATCPIGVILLTYHAFANVVLLYRTLLRTCAPLSKRHVLGEVSDTLSKLEPLESALSSTRALTPRGMTVWSALKERLNQTVRQAAS